MVCFCRFSRLSSRTTRDTSKSIDFSQTIYECDFENRTWPNRRVEFLKTTINRIRQLNENIGRSSVHRKQMQNFNLNQKRIVRYFSNTDLKLSFLWRQTSCHSFGYFTFINKLYSQISGNTFTSTNPIRSSHCFRSDSSNRPILVNETFSVIIDRINLEISTKWNRQRFYSFFIIIIYTIVTDPAFCCSRPPFNRCTRYSRKVSQQYILGLWLVDV